MSATTRPTTPVAWIGATDGTVALAATLIQSPVSGSWPHVRLDRELLGSQAPLCSPVSYSEKR